MEIGTAIALVGALGVGGTVGIIVRWLLSDRKAGEVSYTTNLTGTALSLVQALENRNKTLEDEVAALRDEVARLRAEVQQKGR